MSVNETLVGRTMQVKFNNGTDVNGNAIVTSRVYSNINPAADADAIHHTATRLGSLIDMTLTAVYYSDKMLLESVANDGE